MTGIADEVDAIDRLLLDAKLSIPNPRPGSVSRSALIESVRATDCRVVGITAPAGYGKSTLLSQWGMTETRQVAWVSLNRFDDDPAGLLAILASAFARMVAGNDDLVADMGGSGVTTLGRAAPRLAAALSASPVPFVLMLDDLHELRSPACHDVLEVVISGVPHGSVIAIASRTEQPHLPRLRASGDAVEVLADDLAMGADGAKQIFALTDVELSQEAAAEVTKRTEGWPTGLYLASIIARDNYGQGLNVSGDDRFVADYLYRESLSQLPESTQRFLRRTALLDQLHAPLCDAMLGEHSAQAELRELEGTNSFLIPLDRKREWYRYHGLFREFLLAELRRVEPEIISDLHVRAADWYEASGSPALALEHLLNTSEQDRCVQLVTGLAQPTYVAGQISTVQRWLSKVGDPAIEAFPPLAVLAGWITAMSGQAAETQRWAAIVDASTPQWTTGDGSASFESARGMLRAAMCPSGPEQMMIDAGIAVDQEPAWSPWRDTALCVLGEAHLLTGDVDGAIRYFAEASAVGRELGNSDTIVDSESEIAVVAMNRGQWTEAGESIERALAVIQEHRMQDYATSVLAFAAAARLAVHNGDLKEADKQLSRAMRARPAATYVLPFLAVRSRLQLAMVSWARGDQATAHHLLREIDDILLRRSCLGTLVDEVAEFRKLVTAQPGRAEGGPPLTPAELRLLPYLQTYLTIAEIGQRLFLSRNTVSTEVASIYRKLGVSSRSGAVEKATAMGLLGG